MNSQGKGHTDPGRHESVVLDRRQLAPGTVQLDLARPQGFEFAAGQRIRLHGGAICRDYSLASAPAAPLLRNCRRAATTFTCAAEGR